MSSKWGSKGPNYSKLRSRRREYVVVKKGCLSFRLQTAYALNVSVFARCQTQRKLVFGYSLLQTVFGASHLICHLLLHDNWSNWTSCPWSRSAASWLFSLIVREIDLQDLGPNRGTYLILWGNEMVSMYRATRASEMFITCPQNPNKRLRNRIKVKDRWQTCWHFLGNILIG